MTSNSSHHQDWITKLAPTFPHFWKGLSTLGKCQLNLELGTSGFENSIDFQNTLLDSDGILQIPGAGIAFRTHDFTHAYTTGGLAEGDDPTHLELISLHREIKLTIRPLFTKGLARLTHLAGAFAEEMIPDGLLRDLGEAPRIPSLCPCCKKSGQLRVDQIPHHPITSILASSHLENISLIVTLRTAPGSWTSHHLPQTLTATGDWLVSEGQGNLLRLNIRHLHAMRLGEVILEGEKHLRLDLHNSHGEIYATLAAPHAIAASAWHQLLSLRDHSTSIQKNH